MDPSLYTLFPATPDQVRESRIRTHPQWGRGVPLEEYLERDAKLDTFAHASDGRLTTWVLAPRDDPTTLDFLCACESYRREGFVRLPGDAAAREETMFGIASVYTPPRHRRKGAARHMMRLLHRVLAGDAAALPSGETAGTGIGIGTVVSVATDGAARSPSPSACHRDTMLERICHLNTSWIVDGQLEATLYYNVTSIGSV